MDSLIPLHSAPLALCCIMASVFTDLSGREKLFFFLLDTSAPVIVSQQSSFISQSGLSLIRVFAASGEKPSVDLSLNAIQLSV